MYENGGGLVQECSGTLIAPSVVITAGHCDPNVTAGIGDMSSVLLGTSSLARQQDGELIKVAKIITYPASQQSMDVALLVLSRDSTVAPRPIATGWARFDIVDGADVKLVGFGAVDKNANDYIDDLQQAETQITDADCANASGCNRAAKPAGELGAGGGGIDTCPGDSGGPLYLLTSYGNLLAGVTSRSYDNATVACGQGGIYERPDKIVDWIEMETGLPVARGPEPHAEPIVAVKGDAGETLIDAHDPRSDSHTYEITTPPAHGVAAVRDDGRVRVCSDALATGKDSMVVTVIDANNADRKVATRIDIQTVDGAAPAMCDVTAFSETGGCCSAGRDSRGSALLAVSVLAIMRRRRRR